MAEFDIRKNPEFVETQRKLETTDRAHADLFNNLYQSLFDNDNFLKDQVDNKANKDGGDISDTIAKFDDYGGEGDTAPEAREAIANIKSGGGIKGILSNVKAALMGMVTLGEMRALLVNNGLCTEPGKFFLDAAFGKNLQDQLTKLNSDITPKIIDSSSYTREDGTIHGYIKFADGTAINFGGSSIPITITSNKYNDQLCKSDSINCGWFPCKYKYPPHVTVSCASELIITNIGATTEYSYAKFLYPLPTDFDGATHPIRFIAIGRWK